MDERSCWREPSEAFEEPRLVPIPQRVDVAIIGAGYTGLSAALELAKRGATAAVLEAARIGWGASSRNGGMVLSGLKLGPRELVARFGQRAALAMDAVSIAAIDYVERIIREESIECDFARCGHLTLASKPSHFAEFQREAELLSAQFAREVRVIPKASLHEEIGSEAFWGGLLDAASAGLQPARYVKGLANAALRAGATICEHARVESIEPSVRDGLRGFRVVATRGEVFVRDVIVATGGYTGRAFAALRKRVIPIGSYIIATAPLAEQVANELSPHNRMMFDSRHFLHYFRLTPDRRLLFGGRASFVPETEQTIRTSAHILQRDMIRVFPQLRDTPPERAWGGTIDFTFDMLPHAGRLEGVYYALGYAGHGVGMATYLGSRVARLVAGESLNEPLVGGNFPKAPLGLYNGTPWFLPIVGGWFSLLDLVS